MRCTTITSGYGGQGAQALCHGHGSTVLPFTGLDLLVFVIIGAIFVLLGLFLVALSKGDDNYKAS
jgi:hypothetical protein